MPCNYGYKVVKYLIEGVLVYNSSHHRYNNDVYYWTMMYILQTLFNIIQPCILSGCECI